jgi:hypothetical protein
MSSFGSWSITARATVSPPKPESKIPIGASESGLTAAKRTPPTTGTPAQRR